MLHVVLSFLQCEVFVSFSSLSYNGCYPHAFFYVFAANKYAYFLLSSSLRWILLFDVMYVYN